jgi:hypothetical protein
MPEGTSALLNPTVLASLGVGGIISVILIVVGYKLLIRVDDSIHAFTESLQATTLATTSTISKSIADAISQTHEDNVETVRALDRMGSKLDVLLDRTSRTFEQVAIHRGVSEPPLTGSAPAIITPKS